MAPPKDIARSYPKRGLTADVGFRSEPTFVSEGSIEFVGYSSGGGPFINYSLDKTFSAFTVAAWVLMDGTSTYNIFMRAGGGGSFGGSVAFGWINGTTFPQLRLFDKTGISYIPTQAFPEVKGQWCHVACTINSAGDTIKMYVNGIEATGLTQPTAGNEIEMPGSDGSSIGHFNVGSFQYSATVSSLGIGGKMANFGLYDAELTQDQIIQLMRCNDFATCSAVATPAVFFELFEDNTDSTGNAVSIVDAGTPSYGNTYAQLPRGLDLARGAAMARVYTGRAIELDGSADYLQTTLDSALGTTFTVSSWVYRTSPVSGFDVIWETGTFGANAALRPAIKNTNEGLIDLNDNAGVAVSTKGVGLDRWAHVVICAISGAGNTKIYVDGVDATPASHSVFVNATNPLFEIGRYIGGAHYFKGYISDVRVFNSTLTADQVKELYHYPEKVLPTGVSASNLIHRWALSDYNDTGATGGRYFQDSAGSNAMEDKSSAAMAFAQPVPCPQLGLQQSATRLFFSGGTQGATATITAPGTTVSFSAWVFWDQARTSYAINIGDVVSTSGDGFQIRINASGQITMYQRDGGGVNQELLSGLTVTEGEWNHIVVATRSDSPYWRCWLNNSEASSPNALVNTVNVTSTNCNLGMNNYNFGMAGIANDAAVWNTELGDSDVAALYNSGVQGMDVSTVQSANLLGWWKFDDLTTLKDYSGNGANATVTGTFAAASFPENASGSTIVGDFSMKRKGVSVLNPTATPLVTGVMPGAQIANDGSLNIDPANGGHTVSFFIRVEMGSASGGMMLAPAAGTSGANWHFCYFTSTINAVPPRLQIGDGATTYRDYIWPAAITNPEEWHQLAYTVDFSTSPTTFRLYLDGALVSTQAAYTHLAIDSGDVMHVGNNSSGTLNFPGAIACVKMYQTKLSDDEVEQIYRSDLRLIKGLANE